MGDTVWIATTLTLSMYASLRPSVLGLLGALPAYVNETITPTRARLQLVRSGSRSESIQ